MHISEKKTVSLPKVHRWCNQNVWVVHLSLRWPGTHAGRYGAPGCSTYEGMQLHQNLVLRDAEQPRWTKMNIFDRRTFAYIFWVVQIGEQLHTLLFYLIFMFFCQTVKSMEGFLRNTIDSIDSRIGRIWQDRGVSNFSTNLPVIPVTWVARPLLPSLKIQTSTPRPNHVPNGACCDTHFEGLGSCWWGKCTSFTMFLFETRENFEN